MDHHRRNPGSDLSLLIVDAAVQGLTKFQKDVRLHRIPVTERYPSGQLTAFQRYCLLRHILMACLKTSKNRTEPQTTCNKYVLEEQKD